MRSKWEQTGDWRDYRTYAKNLSDTILRSNRDNGYVLVPFITLHPNIGDDSTETANARWVEENFEEVDTIRIRHWATPMEWLAVPATHANMKELARAASSLLEYPVLCESTWSDVEYEMIEDSINAYAADDLARECNREYDTDVDGADVAKVLAAWMGTLGDYPEVIGRDVRWPDADENLARMATKVSDES